MAVHLREREKMGTVLDAAVARRLRALAANEGRSISDLIGEAVRQYEAAALKSFEERRDAMDSFLKPAFKLPRRDVDHLLRLEYYEQ